MWMPYAKNLEGQHAKRLCRTIPKMDFFVWKIMKIKNKSETVQIWHGAMIWLHNAVVKNWDGFETVAM